jgi:hypothetical protein
MRRFLAILFIFIIALGFPASTLAQGNYYFSVDEETVHVYWNEDGTISLNYVFMFTNQPGAHVIDFVDVGMPNSSFDMGTISADVDGVPVNVSRGDYQGSGSGFAVDMGSQAIAPGDSGRVNVRVGVIRDMIFEDSEDNTYASGEFAPMWFDSQFVTGDTYMTVVFHLPPGIQPDEPRYHIPKGWPGADEPNTDLDQDGRVTYTWISTANAHSQYTFGASFPRTYVPDSAIQTEPTFTFPSINFDDIISLGCCGFFAFMFIGMPVLGVINGQRRKLKYLPPKIKIEGHGIKRGLTAVEAAILMEQSLDKVMTMILFGVVKKGAAEVLKRDPLELKIIDPAPEGLHEYEKGFLKAFDPGNNSKQRREELQTMTIQLIKSVSTRMKGFSRKETLEYYKTIMERAWEQIAAADTPEVQSQLVNDAMEWTMLDKDYDDRARRTYTGPIYVPMWWGRYDPGYGGSIGSSRPLSAPTSVPSSRSTGLPGADFAASVVGGVQSFSNKVIGNVGDFTSRVTNKTNPVPKSTSSGRSWSGGGGGGSSCACACACAGCACACAGGGR